MRICSGAGCLRAIPDDVRFCADCKPASAGHADEAKTHTSGYDAELDKLRVSPRFQRLAHRVRREQPMCARCDRQLSEITDHKVPAREAIEQARASGKYPFDRYAGYFLRSNLQGVCRPCHYVKTNEDKTHTGPWPSVMDAEAAAPKKTYSF